MPGIVATLYKRPDGLWAWKSGYRNFYTGSPSEVVASQSIQQAKRLEEQRAAPKQVVKPTAFEIDAQGRAFADGRPLGQARRVRNLDTGRVAWRFDIPNGWTLIRYDGESGTTKHLFKR